MRFSTQYAILTSVLILALFAAVTLLQANTVRGQLEQRQQQWAKSLTSSLAESLARDVINGNAVGVKEVLDNIVRNNREIGYAYVTDFEHHVMAYTFVGGFPAKLLDVIDVHDDRELDKYISIDGKRYKNTVFPIIQGMSSHLHLGIDAASNEAAYQKLFGELVLTFSLAIVVGIGINIVLGRLLSRPLAMLTAQLQRYGEGEDLRLKALPHASHEVQELELGFRKMIMARQKAETALRASLELNDHVVNASPMGISIYDGAGQCLAANEAVTQIVGASKDEILAQNFFHVPSWKEYGLLREAELAIGSGKRRRGEFKVTNVFGKQLVLDCQFVPFRKGNETHLMLMIDEISERKRVEEELRQYRDHLEYLVEVQTKDVRVARDEAERANAAKSEFLSRMSHELRTPLNAILGFGQILESDTEQPLTVHQAESLREIMHAGQHLLALVNEVLDLSRIESGRLEVSLEPVEVSSMVEACVTQLKPMAKDSNITIALELASGLVVKADATRFKQVLLNLLSNAIKYNHKDGHIRVHSAPSGKKYVRISVEDSGRGIAPEAISRLFQPFERLGTAYDGSEGTGIGLALVKKLVQAMRGRVGVESTPGVGSTFWFELMLSDEQPGEIAVGSEALVDEPHSDGAIRKVLYVEDNPANLRLVQKILAGRGNIVLYDAVNAEQGLLVAAEEAPDLILLDINLPGMDGFEALRRLKENPATTGIPVIAVTANAMVSDVEHGKAAGFDDYLVKPIDVVQFNALIHQWLNMG